MIPGAYIIQKKLKYGTLPNGFYIVEEFDDSGYFRVFGNEIWYHYSWYNMTKLFIGDSIITCRSGYSLIGMMGAARRIIESWPKWKIEIPHGMGPTLSVDGERL